MNSYIAVGLTCALLFTLTCAYVYRFRKSIDCMHGMMVGMSLGMIAGLVTATLFLIPTGNFLWGVIIGTVVGLAVGIPFGKLGSHIGVMEGIMAGPMGGMMGAMLGQMIRPFSIEIFMPFFVAIFLLTLVGIIYMIDCCRKKTASNLKIGLIVAVCIILLAVSVILPFSIEEQSANAEIKLPAYIQQAIVDEPVDTVLKDNYQEATIQIVNSRYSPNVIRAKKGVPLKLHFKALSTAGCASEVVFPSLNLNKIVRTGTSETVELSIDEEGTINFRCSMDMAHGRIEVS